MRLESPKFSLLAVLALGVPLALLACGDAVTPTQPELAAAPAVSAAAPGGSPLVVPGAAQELMLRARGETAGPFGGPPLVGTAWVHVIGQPETAAVTVLSTGPPGPAGVPTSHIFDFGSGDYFKTADLATFDPPFAGPGEYSLGSTLTIMESGGAYAGMTGTLEIIQGTVTVGPPPELMATAEWHMKGRVRLGG